MPLGTRNLSILEKLESNSIPVPFSGCFLWTGSTSYGYGLIRWNGKQVRAHRLAYQYFKGPIPEGKEINHLCEVRCCVNPAHLEAVTHRENILYSFDHSRNQSHPKTKCKRGHPLEGENLYFGIRHGKRFRGCKECRRLHSQWNRERKKNVHL